MKLNPHDPNDPNDPNDPRLGEIVKLLDDPLSLTPNSHVILGYPDDEGISLSRGRVGAREAPHTVREKLYRMTPSLKAEAIPVIFDAGNITIEGLALAKKHELAQNTVQNFLKRGCFVSTIGGGHDYGYPDMAAFCEYTLSQGKKPLVINFDAHLDVREDKNGFSSGTPFYRLLKEYSKKIDFFEIGIQDWCNSKNHQAWAKEHGAQIISLEEIQESGSTLFDYTKNKFLNFTSLQHSVALSVDIDCFSSEATPGASQVFPTGLDFSQFLVLWRWLMKEFSPKVCGLYEVSPVLDQGDKTSYAAAILIHQSLFR